MYLLRTPCKEHRSLVPKEKELEWLIFYLTPDNSIQHVLFCFVLFDLYCDWILLFVIHFLAYVGLYKRSAFYPNLLVMNGG